MKSHSLRAAAFAAALGTALCAQAQTCPTPTLDQCASNDYRASACFASYTSYCDDLINSEWNAQAGALPQVDHLLPDKLGGGVAPVGELPVPSPKGSNFYGLHSQVPGLVSQNQILYRKGFKDLSGEEAKHADELTTWAKNGSVIRSCREYVHEKYLDYSRFEAEAGADAANFRAFFNRAFAKDGIADRTLYGADQKPLAPIFDGKQAWPKNAFFRFQPGPYPAGQTPYAFTSEAAKKANDASARAFFVITDDWNAKMSDTLAKENDDVLDEERVKERDFEDLLAQRDSIWASYQSVLKSSQGSPEVDKGVAEDLRSVDARIEKALEGADADGCLDAKNLTHCDWSPRLYKDLVSQIMDQRRQADLTQCLQLTADDFSDTSFVRNAQDLKLPTLPETDYTVDLAHLEQYLREYGAYIAGLDVPTDPSTGLTRRGDTFSDSGEFGDRSTFAGAISYGGDWSATWGSTFCDANLHFGANATANAWIFGSGAEIAHLEGYLETQASDLHLFVLARVVGAEVYRTDTTTPAFLDFQVANPHFEDHSLRASATFTVVFVPVTVSAGLAADIGVEFRLGGDVARDCSIDSVGIDLVGTVKPYVSLSGFASVAVGVPYAQVGVRGELLIARVDVPLRGSAGIYLSSSSELMLRTRLSLGIQQRYLDGKIVLFGELGPFSAEVPIVSWQGFGGPEVTLFSTSADVPLARL